MTIIPQDIERAEKWAKGGWQRLSQAADILAKNWLAEFLLNLIAEHNVERERTKLMAEEIEHLRNDANEAGARLAAAMKVVRAAQGCSHSAINQDVINGWENVEKAIAAYPEQPCEPGEK